MGGDYIKVRYRKSHVVLHERFRVAILPATFLALSLCIPLFHSFFSSCPPRNRLKLEGFR